MANKVGAIVVSLDLDTKQLKTSVRTAEGQITQLSKQKVKVDTTVNDAPLKSLEAGIAQINGSVANIKALMDDGDIRAAEAEIAKLNGQTVNVKVEVDKSALADTSKLSENMGGAATGAAGAGLAIAKWGIPAAFIGGIGGLVVGAEKLDTNIRKIATLLPELKPDSIDKLKNSVLSLSEEIGMSMEDVSDAIYNALGSGIPENNVFDFVKTASKTAIAGATDLESVTAVLTGTVNAYTPAVLSAAQASDVLTQGVNLGVFTMKDLVANISDVTPIAAAMNVPLSDAVGWLAKLTKQGIPVAQASTSVKQAMSELSDSTSIAGKNFKEISGKTFAEFIKKGGKIEGALQLMEKAAKKNGNTIADMFGSIQAKQGVLPVMGANFKDFTEVLDGVRNSAGATDKAYKVMDEGIGRSLSRFWTTIKDVFFRVAGAFTPLIAAVGQWFEKHKKFFEDAGKIAAGLLTVLFTGNFDKELFGGKLSEKSGIIKFLEDVHDKAVTAFEALKQLLTGKVTPGELGSKKTVDLLKGNEPGGKSAAARAERRIGVQPQDMSQTQKNLQGVRDVLEGINSAFETMFGWIFSIADFLGGVLSKAWNFLWDLGLKYVVEEIASAWRSISDQLGKVPGLAGAVKLSLKLLAVVALVPLLLILGPIIGALFVFLAVLEIIRGVLWVIEGIVKVITALFTGLGRAIKGAFEPLKGVPGAAGKWIGEQLDKLSPDFRAEGGPVARGQSYIVGERGPELFVPNGSGTIMTNGETQRLMSSGGGTNTSGGNVYLSIDASGIMATSRSHQRQVISTLIEAANEELIGRGLSPIADNKLRAAQ